MQIAIDWRYTSIRYSTLFDPRVRWILLVGFTDSLTWSICRTILTLPPPNCCLVITVAVMVVYVLSGGLWILLLVGRQFNWTLFMRTMRTHHSKSPNKWQVGLFAVEYTVYSIQPAYGLVVLSFVVVVTSVIRGTTNVNRVHIIYMYPSNYGRNVFHCLICKRFVYCTSLSALRIQFITVTSKGQWREHVSFDVEGCYKTQYNVRSVFSIAFVPAVPEFVIHKYEIIYVSFSDRWLIYHMG